METVNYIQIMDEFNPLKYSRSDEKKPLNIIKSRWIKTDEHIQIQMNLSRWTVENINI